jgi:hypothetical protein
MRTAGLVPNARVYSQLALLLAREGGVLAPRRTESNHRNFNHGWTRINPDVRSPPTADCFSIRVHPGLISNP